MGSILRIPDSLTFADLALSTPARGRLMFLPAPLGEFAVRNGLDAERVGDEDFACKLICNFYVLHRDAGAARIRR